ncbi:MAG: hypothetical protein ACREGB_01640, partial [Candidatus Saccharimonadales bacterium]
MADQKFDIKDQLADESTPADVLHGHAQNYLKLDPESQNTHYGDFANIIDHPKVSGDTLATIYAHMFKPSKAEPDGNEHPEDSDSVEKIAKHPNTPAAVTEDYLKRTYKASDYDSAQTHKEASSKPGVSVDVLENILGKLVNDPSVVMGDRGSLKDYDVRPQFLLDLLKGRGIPEPEEGNMTEAQKRTNNRVRKVDSATIKGLSTSDKHDDSTLDATTGLFTSDIPYGMDSEKFLQAKHHFIDHQKNLSGRHLDALAESKRPDGLNDYQAMEKVANHPNVDPKYLAKLATMDVDHEIKGIPENDDHWQMTRDLRDAVRTAISHPNLPDVTRRALVDRADASAEGSHFESALLDNPALKEDEVLALHHKGFKKALLHPSIPDEEIEKYYDEHPDTETARHLLQRPKLPESLLRKMVNHKNQNVAIDALNHPSSNAAVVDEGLKRKAADVQDAAAKHPLVAKRVMLDRVREGKIPASQVLFDKNVRGAIGDITPPMIEAINGRYKNTDKDFVQDTGETQDSFWQVKNWLATDPSVPGDVQQKNRTDIIDKFKQVAPDTNFWELNGHHANKEYQNVTKSLVSLAQSGDIHAQDAMLQHPDVIFSNSDLTTGKYTPEFFRKFADLYANNGFYKSVNNSTPQSLNPGIRTAGKLKQAALNPECPQDA